ncbi:MAG: Ppx/GppA phosphatase family protein [Acidimicrobiia bacterium]
MRIAALDLGTNSFHLLVADVHADGHFEAITREKEMLRLGDVVSREGRITDAAADAAVSTVGRFKRMAEAAGATELHACATSAIRVASNGDALVDRIEDETGVGVEVISGMREAELIFGAIRASVLLEPAPALCFDLGGGSVEIMVGDAGGLRWATSENLGVGRLTAEFVSTDPISKDERRRLRAHLVDVLTPVASEVAAFHPKLFVGSSGTLGDLAHMAAARRAEDVPISLNQLAVSRDELEPLHKVVLASTADQRVRLDGLEARRVDLIAAGSIFLTTAMELFAFDELTISEWALREGIVLDAIRRHDPEDWSDDPRALRRASVHGLARRCNWDEAHSRQVATLALALYDRTQELHQLGSEDREILEYAALLHDIGEHVSPSGHHKHGAYLVQNGRLRGFAPGEVQLLAAIARWHRRGTPVTGDEYGMVDESRLRSLTALLRIADGLDRGRSGAIETIEVNVGPSLVVVQVHAHHDVELEVWGARRKRELFERIFGRDLELTVRTNAARGDLSPTSQ